MPRRIGRNRCGANAETQTQNLAHSVDISAYKVSTYDGKSIYILLSVQKSLYAQSEAMFFRRAQTRLRQTDKVDATFICRISRCNESFRVLSLLEVN